MELVGVVGVGGKYHDFQSFTLPELMQHIGLYLLEALSPSPQVDIKFHSQKEDPVNRNDFVFNSFSNIGTIGILPPLLLRKGFIPKVSLFIFLKNNC